MLRAVQLIVHKELYYYYLFLFIMALTWPFGLAPLLQLILI